MIWHQFTNVMILDQQMRQPEDRVYLVRVATAGQWCVGKYDKDWTMMDSSVLSNRKMTEDMSEHADN